MLFLKKLKIQLPDILFFSFENLFRRIFYAQLYDPDTWLKYKVVTPPFRQTSIGYILIPLNFLITSPPYFYSNSIPWIKLVSDLDLLYFHTLGIRAV